MRLRSANLDDEAECRRVDQDLSEAVRGLGALMKELPPRVGHEAVLNFVFDLLDLGAVTRTLPEYAGGDRLAMAAEAFRLHLAASSQVGTTWSECLDEFEGVCATPLMTVHKSKGLEFDTILFVGLDDKMWWSHQPGQPEGIATFFVALTRAKQRAVFTFCRARGGRHGIRDLHGLLADAGVSQVEFSRDERARSDPDPDRGRFR
ncbi:MAG: 3'-5' exonuclease [Dehalococcoidia bacterium]